MIVDTLENCARYIKLHPYFEKAFAFLQQADPNNLPDGRIELDGENLFAIVQSYVPRKTESEALEAHREYIDIQFMLAGQEQIGYAPLCDATPEQPYDAKKDFASYRGDTSFLRMRQGMFAIFYPEDAHQPCQPSDISAPVRKIVVKAAVLQ